MSESIQTVTFAEYLALEQSGDQRHDFVGNRIYTMAGGTERHELMKDAIYSRWRAGALAAGCRPFTGRMLRTPSGNVYYPDVLVVCGRPADRLFENDATILVEVTSSSTREIDRREKLASYGQCPSIQMYAIVDPVFRSVELATWDRGTVQWTALGSGEVLMSPYGDIDLDDLYDEVDAIAT
jgi:Uma2 family endonuclease